MSFTAAFTIDKSDLPVNCALENPPTDVTIALAQIFDATGTPITLGISASGTGFVIPSTIPVGSATLEVAVTGGGDADEFQPINVNEATTPPTLLGTIQDGNSKFVQVALEVLS